MTRKDDLLALFSDEATLTIVSPLIDELCYVEEQIAELKKQPFIRYHPKNPAIQKITPAARLYKDLLAKETDITRTLCGILKKSESDGEISPLRAYLEQLDNTK